MLKRSGLLVIPFFALTVLAVPPLVFLTRSPVLVVTDVPFIALYGMDRMKREQATASFALFRRVKPVIIADDAGSDILVVALTKAASRPFCVLFPRRHAMAAQRYHEQFPEIHSILLGGLNPVSDLPSSDGFLYVLQTDRDTDLYRAGLFAGILADLRQKQAGISAMDESERGQRTFSLWHDRSVTADQRELFSRGARESAPESMVVFAGSTNDMPDTANFSCVVLAGAGSEYLEKHPAVPIILFSWVNPVMVPQEVMVVFDDSPWGLAVPVAQMVRNKQVDSRIPSKPLIISGNIADNSIFRMLKKSVDKTP